MAVERLQDATIALLQATQPGLLSVLHWLGLAPFQHGQPAWPFSVRLATETLAIDAGLTRQVVIATAGGMLALALLCVGVFWRRARWPSLAGAAALIFLIAWPPRSLLLTEAHTTSFHRSPTGFRIESIDRGLVLFRSQCAACHGADGRGEGPLAASLAMWPPRLTAELLQRRAEGETFWHILGGMRDRHGAETMPAFGARLDDAQVWSLIDAMKVIAAGIGIQDDAAWSEPIRVPDAWVRCRDGSPPRRLSNLRGQRLRIVAAGGTDPLPREDPRLATIVLRPADLPVQAPCEIDDPGSYAVFARLSGTTADAFGGAQLIVDRGGWLRAYGRPGKVDWSEGDLLCRSTEEAAHGAAQSPDGLGDLIAAIDADPVRTGAIGLAHGRLGHAVARARGVVE